MFIQDVRFNNYDSLTKVYEMNQEAELALKDPTRQKFTQTSKESETLVSKRNLLLSALGGMVIAMFFFTSVGVTWRRWLFNILDWFPGDRAIKLIVLVLIIGALVIAYIRQQREELNETKQQLYKQTLTNDLAITKELNHEEGNGNNKDRISYLTGLVLMLKVLIRGLEYDLRLNPFDQETE